MVIALPEAPPLVDAVTVPARRAHWHAALVADVHAAVELAGLGDRMDAVSDGAGRRSVGADRVQPGRRHVGADEHLLGDRRRDRHRLPHLVGGVDQHLALPCHAGHLDLLDALVERLRGGAGRGVGDRLHLPGRDAARLNGHHRDLRGDTAGDLAVGERLGLESGRPLLPDEVHPDRVVRRVPEAYRCGNHDLAGGDHRRRFGGGLRGGGLGHCGDGRVQAEADGEEGAAS